MNISKKALSLLLSVTLIASTAVSTGAFAATATGSQVLVSNTSVSGESDLQAAKENLTAAIENASQYTDSSKYTTGSWSNFQVKLEKAKACQENPEATAADFQAATTNLKNAVEGLVNAAAAKENLKNEIETANSLKEADYTDVSWKVFTTALTNAKACYENPEAKAADFQAATTNLKNAVEGLVDAAAAKENLKNEIETASSLKEADYTDVSWKVFTTALTNAKACYENPEAKATDFQAAITNLKNAIRNLAMTSQKEEDTINGIKGIPDSPNAGNAATIESLAAQAEHFSASDKKKLTPELVKKLEDALATVSNVGKPSPTLDFSGISSSDQKMTSAPVVSGLLLASGYTGAGTVPALGLIITQDASANPSNRIVFDANFTVDGQRVHDLFVPVTVTIHLPESFVYNPSYTYSVHHVKALDGSTEELTPTFNTTNRTMTFTTNSFSDFTLTGTAPTHTGGSSGSSSTGSPTTTTSSPAATFVSDTTSNFGVSGAYTFKITSKDGKAPRFVVGTPGVFDVKLVKQVGNDYYYKITAVGTPGTQAGIYINGGPRLLIATIKTNPTYVKSDTTAPFKVKAGKSYVFKLTANAKPYFVAGTGSAFKVSFVKQNGKDYFFKVTAIGKVGQACGFYINSHNSPVAVAMVA